MNSISKLITKLKPLITGLWHKNPALVQLLGLCPLLGISNSCVNALGLGIATTFVLVLSNMLVSTFRTFVDDTIRIPVFVMLIASLTTSIELLMQAYVYELYQTLGIFIPLIVTNCIILGRAEAFAAKNSVLKSAIDGLSMGLGFAVVLVLIGIFRELIGQGTVFNNMELLFGSSAINWKIVISIDYPKFLFFVLPPGAFITLGLLIALKNIIDQRKKISMQQAVEPERIRIIME
jgi:electron transport complex protein RnfE